MKIGIATILLAAFCSVAVAQQPATTSNGRALVPQHQPNFESERKQANDLFVAGEVLQSLPLYEDLCRQDPTIAVFAERHGAGLLRKASTLTDPAAKQVMLDQGMAEIRRAARLGDNSGYVQNTLSSGSRTIIGSAINGLQLSVGYLYHGSPEAQPVMKEAEQAFGREDLPGALKLYTRAAALDPKWYDAALYAGDMCFREGRTTPVHGLRRRSPSIRTAIPPTGTGAMR